MQVFDPNQFPVNPEQFPGYGAEKVKKLAEKLGYRPREVASIVNQWQSLMTDLGTDQKMCQRQDTSKMDAGLFYTSLLKDKVIQDDELRGFIIHLLALPTGEGIQNYEINRL